MGIHLKNHPVMSLCSSITATCGSNGFMVYHYVPMWCNESIYYAYLMTPSFRGIFLKSEFALIIEQMVVHSNPLYSNVTAE